MTTSEWEARWIKVLTDRDTPYAKAMETFRVRYGNQDIDSRVDPVIEAKSFLSNKFLPRRNTSFANHRDA